MSRNTNTDRPRKFTQALRPNRASEPTRLLSFPDLEIPVRPLLTRAQEQRSGHRIKVCLSRLARLLPLHPVAYERFLARMTAVADGGGLMFSWLSLRTRIAADAKVAARALKQAHARIATRPGQALKALQPGLQVLRTYPLDPETLTQWARESVDATATSPLFRVEYFRRVQQVLQRMVKTLEKARDELVLPNFRLVLKEAFRYHPTGMKRSDLFQEGILGLQKAVYRFDAGRNIRFSTYATYWIRQSIRKCLVDKSRMIRVPQAIQEELRKTDGTLSDQERTRLRKVMGDTYLFSYGDSRDAEDRLGFEVTDPTHPELGAELHTATIPRVVKDALGGLTSREREIVQRRFGLSGERPQTLEEIGDQLSLSRERIRQIEKEALTRMRRSRDLMEVFEDLDLVESSPTLTHN